MKELLIFFEKSVERLEEILKEKKTDITRDAAIQRFEFTVELSWKTTQKFLKDQGIICRSPKECFKEAFKFGLIEDDPKWIEVLNDRNLTVHTYNEKLAEEIYSRLPDYLKLFIRLKNGLETSSS